MAANINPKPVAPPGLQKLIEHCSQIYPDQPNPLQVTTVLKYWLGGHDPLDYISMYHNAGDPKRHIPPHWHYISFGLSDLHGDGRVHQPDSLDANADGEPLSGMGFELSFRLVKSKSSTAEANNERPPTWPANLLQSLALYVFETGNRLCAGDNVPWRKSLDGTVSRIQHMLITTDAQLERVRTPFGWVNFCQIVGVTEAELEQASRWNGNGVVNLLRKDVATGGEWLICDMARSKSVFELFPDTLGQLEHDLELQGSDLAGINAEFRLLELPKLNIKTEIEEQMARLCSLNDNSPPSPVGAETVAVVVKTEPADPEVQENETTTTTTTSPPNTPLTLMSLSSSSMTMCCPVQYQPIQSRMLPLDGLHVSLAPYAAKFLMLAIKDRIRHGRHFTFKCENRALTFVSESVSGSVVTKAAPYAVLGYWTQILIPDELVPKMIDDLKGLLLVSSDKLQVPQSFEWSSINFKITIDNVMEPQVPLV